MKQEQVNIEVVNIDDLIQDDHNFNKGTEAGAELIGRSFKEHGAGRSVFIDKNNRLVGGNKAQKVSGKNLTVIDDEGETEQTNTNSGEQGGGGNPPSGELEG